MQTWSNQEIIYSYKTAKDQDAQIAILSELTLKSPAEIVSILRAAGLPIKDKKHRKATRQYGWTEEEDAQLLRLLRDGLPGEKIVELTGRSRPALVSHVAKLQTKGYDVRIHFGTRCVRFDWPKEEVQKLKELMAQGLKYSEISQYFPDKNYDAILRKARKIKQKGA